MAVVKPFRAWRYNQKLALQDVVVPPYDVISPLEKIALKKKSPYNFAKLILPQDPAPDIDTYAEAVKLLRDWREESILVEDPKPSLYFYKQTFKLDSYELFCQKVAPEIKAGGTLTRTGIFARIGLEEYSSKIILPHEKTFASHKADRYKLMQATSGNMEPVFLGYDSDRFSGDEFEKIVLLKKPNAEYTDQFGVSHKLWAVDDELVIETVEKILAAQRLYILDGHHRYETALQFYKDHKNFDSKLCHRYVLADICSFKQPGTIILPTHRLVKGVSPDAVKKARADLAADFEFVAVPDFNELEQKMAFSPYPVFGLQMRGTSTYTLIAVKKTSPLASMLDLDILHEKILPALAKASNSSWAAEVEYVKNISEWHKRLEHGEFDLGFLVRPTTSDDVIKVALESRKMPHKSTFFYPKIPSGLVVNLFE